MRRFRRRHTVTIDGEQVQLGAHVADVDPVVNAIVTEAAAQVLGQHAKRSLCFAIDHPDHDGGWICDLPIGHAGTHMVHGRNGAVLRVWDNDWTPALGIPRPARCTSTRVGGSGDVLVCGLPANHTGDHWADSPAGGPCGCHWNQP